MTHIQDTGVYAPNNLSITVLNRFMILRKKKLKLSLINASVRNRDNTQCTSREYSAFWKVIQYNPQYLTASRPTKNTLNVHWNQPLQYHQSTGYYFYLCKYIIPNRRVLWKGIIISNDDPVSQRSLGFVHVAKVLLQQELPSFYHYIRLLMWEISNPHNTIWSLPKQSYIFPIKWSSTRFIINSDDTFLKLSLVLKIFRIYHVTAIKWKLEATLTKRGT